MVDLTETPNARRTSSYPALGPGDANATLTTSSLGGWTVITAVGDLEWSVSSGLRSLLLTTLRDRIVVDLGAVGYLDHHCLAWLAKAHRYRQARGGEVRLVSPPRSALLMMRSARAFDLPPVFPTLGEAVA